MIGGGIFAIVTIVIHFGSFFIPRPTKLGSLGYDVRPSVHIFVSRVNLGNPWGGGIFPITHTHPLGGVDIFLGGLSPSTYNSRPK